MSSMYIVFFIYIKGLQPFLRLALTEIHSGFADQNCEEIKIKNKNLKGN